MSAVSSRFTFYRIILPGGIVVVLLVLSVRILGATPGIEPPWSQALTGFLEDPFTGIASAFAIGLVLYWLDPGYGAPQYYAHIPSSHLRDLMLERGVQGDHLSLYFQAMHSLMPDGLREQGLLYGAFYRIGFQATTYAILVGAALPLGIAMTIGPPGRSQRWPPWIVVASIILIACLVAWPFLRCLFKGRGVSIGLVLTLYVFGSTMGTLSTWGNYAGGWFDSRVDRESLLAAYAGVLFLAWLALRLVGPLRPYWRYFRGGMRGKPDNPHTEVQIGAINSSPAIFAVAGLAATGASLAPIQVIGITSILGVGLGLAILRKHERQLTGIYKNQNQWLTANLDKVLTLLPASVLRAGR